jgi:hypothetical protein
MAAAGEDRAGDAALEGKEESERSFFEGKKSVAAAELDAAVQGDAIDGGRIDAQSVDGIEHFMGRFVRGRKNRRCQKTPQREKPHPSPHTRSVVTFGMGEQGG